MPDPAPQLAAPAPPPTLRLQPSGRWVPLRLRELWHYRDLLYFLTWRDVKVRYKQTVLGAAWAVLNPFFMMVVFSVFFGRLAGIPSDGIPYPVFTYTALLPWMLFSHALIESSNSLIANQSLITKVYFPRLLVPLSTVLAGIMDFLIAFVVLLAMLLYYGIRPGWAMLTLPLFLLLTILTALSVGIWFSALNVRYRDVRYTIPFLTQAWMFLTPIAYSSTLVPEKYRLLYALNPMAGVVNAFRWALLGNAPPMFSMLAVSTAVVLFTFITGLYYFRRVERTFADTV